jgi:hypothetical protein
VLGLSRADDVTNASPETARLVDRHLVGVLIFIRFPSKDGLSHFLQRSERCFARAGKQKMLVRIFLLRRAAEATSPAEQVQQKELVEEGRTAEHDFDGRGFYKTSKALDGPINSIEHNSRRPNNL